MDTATAKNQLRFNVYQRLEKGGRRHYLNVRNKVIRKFQISPNTWDLWCKKKADSSLHGDFPALVLLFLSTEMNVPIECFFTENKDEKCLEL